MEKEPGQGVGDSGKMGVNVCSRKVPKWGRALENRKRDGLAQAQVTTSQ